jgi:hypothetical protein
MKSTTIIVAVAFLVFIPSLASAGTYGGGSGEPNDPYLIYTPQQLNQIGATPADWAKHFKLMADLDLSCYTGTQFNRIGTSYSSYFSGTFDGNNHTISNFTYTSTTTDYVGLFGYVGPGSQIKNLGLTNVNVTGHNYTGGLVGYNRGTITNSYATGSVTGQYQGTGVLVGENIGTITNSYANGSVTGYNSTGGLVGYNYGTISNCYATGSVTGYNSTGGLVGYNYGTISNCYATGSVTGQGDNTGGLVGFNYHGTITNSYATGSVTGQRYVGGLVGGLAGFSYWDSTITNCYAIGGVTGGSYTGGLVGYRYSGSVTASFWDIETTGQSTSAGGTGKTTAEMHQAATFLGWNGCGDVVWTIDEGNDYPRLIWENRPGTPIPSYDLTDFLAGSGTAQDPYLIYTPQELNTIGWFPCEWDKHFKLMADIDLAAYTGVEFNLIGVSPAKSFTGTFDGNNHTISNFTYTSPTTDYVGLFGTLSSGGQVKNLGLINVNVTGRGYTGGLVGYNEGAITNCYADGTVSGSYYTGGLVGGNDDTITNSYATGSVTGLGWDTGGLAGYNYGTITNCYATGRVTGSNYVGGLVGFGGGVVNSFWDIETTGQSTSAGGTGKTTAEMHQAATFLGWNGCGDVVWTIDEGNDYPRLIWENRPGTPIPSYDLTDFLAGSGTAQDPYLIYTPQELNTIGWFPCEWDKHFKLMADIDLAAYTGVEFNLIGVSPAKSFTGTFDGNNHTISNFTYTSPTADYVGLFGYVGSGGQVKNLGLINVNVTGSSYTGGLVGVNSGTITNSYAAGNVTGQYESAGGLVGYNNIQGTITNCYATGNVAELGGLGYYTGGLVGSNSGTITNSYATENVAGYLETGGLVGGNSGTVANSYATGNISGTDYAGGLVGGNGGAITNCYATGNVTAGDFTGGLVGVGGNGGTITNSYATGNVSGIAPTGGLVGYRSGGGTVTASFWDIETTGRSTSAGGTGKTTAEMKTKSTFTSAGWDFVGEVTNGTNDIWRMCVDGVSYPLLWWQFPTGDFDCPDGVNLGDFAFFAQYWLETGCAAISDCRHTDINLSGTVDIADLGIFTENWLETEKEEGLVGWWKFDETSGAIAWDSSCYGNHGRLANGPVWTGQGELHFDGIDDYMEVAASDSLTVSTGLTLSVWVYLHAYGSDWPKVIIKPYTAYAEPWELYCIDLSHYGNYPRFIITDGLPGGSIGYTYNSSYNLSLNTWYHIAGTYDGSVLYLYVNGEPIASQPASVQIGNNAMPVCIGGRLGVNSFDGLLDDVRIYNRALTQEEVASLFNE